MDTASKQCRVDWVRKRVIADVCRIVDQDTGKSARHCLAFSADAVSGIPHSEEMADIVCRF